MELKESETVELKKSTSELKEGIISMAAILNKHHKGMLYFGVSNKGEVVGQQVTENTLREVSKAVSDSIEPKIYPEISKETINGKECIKVSFAGEQIPYFAFGRAYIRVADESKPLSAKEMESIILKKHKGQLCWDAEACVEASIEDIGRDKLKNFLAESGRKFDNVKNSLNKLGLLKADKPVNAAVILFGKNPERFFHNARLRCAVFGSSDTSVTIDMQDFKGDLFYLIEEAEKYFLKNIHIGMKVEGLKRIDIPEISKEAFREAIINGFCHRDYWKPDSVNVAVFKDRVEVRSPGLLCGGLTIERIRKENVSERRNEVIARIFHEVHFVENWGRGISKILSLEPEADFKEVGTHFITVFPRKERDLEKGVERLGEKLGEKLGENPRKIIHLMSEKKTISIPEIADSIGISTTAVENNITKLKKKGILKRVGPDKGGYWEVVHNSPK